MFSKLKNRILLKYFFTKYKIVTIESDDWGYASIYNKDKYDNIKNKIYNFNTPYAYFVLENKNDLNMLQNICLSHKDIYGINCQFTANFIVEKPNFQKIQKDNYQNLYFERIKIAKYKDIIKNKVFFPQYHGRHHFNIKNWLYDLQNNKNNARFFVDNEVFVLNGINTKYYNGENAEVTDKSIKYHDENYLKYLIKDGLKIFHDLFKFHSQSVIAPSYYKNNVCDKLYAESGIQIFQADNLSHLQKVNGQLVNKITHNGNNINNVISLCRNVFFEPSTWFFKRKELSKMDRSILYKVIDIKYRKGNPLIICSHSYNYVGSLNKEMFNFSIFELDKLLKYLERNKNCIYLNSVELGILYKDLSIKHGNTILKIPNKITIKILIVLLNSSILNISNVLSLFLIKIQRKINAR